MKMITINVNGKEYKTDDYNQQTTLLDYLRCSLRLTAAKNGCGEGQCGSCTVLVNSKPKRACNIKIADMDGASVQTLEDLSTDSSIHAIQYAFLEHGAVQCGYCTPGMIMAAKALLDNNDDPSEKEIKRALSANLCRCTGYLKIIKAVKAAAEYIRKGKHQFAISEIKPNQKCGIGKPAVSINGIEKVTGKLMFADDLHADHMIYAKVLRSAHPHARIKKVDVAKARIQEGVVEVLTAKDIPGINRFGVVEQDQPVLADKEVLWIGEAVAAVYAKTSEIAEKALDLIEVIYEPLEVVPSALAASKNPATLKHSEENRSICCELNSGDGDVDTAFAGADIVIEDEYYTPFIEHAYLEPESCLAIPDKSGGLTIYAATQGPFSDRKQIASALNISQEKVHLMYCPMGGGFGGKEDITVQIIAGLGALKTGYPVKYTFSRKESIRASTKRHAFYMNYKTGASKEGDILAVDAKIIADSGAYSSLSEAVLTRSVSFAGGPYNIPHARVEGMSFFSNNNPAGAFRGFGNPQVAFAAEVQLNRIAEKLGLDQFEIRLKNALEVGSTTITGDKLKYSVGVKECLTAVQKALASGDIPNPREGWKRGIGVAAAYKNVGIGIGLDDSAGATVEIGEDGYLILRIGAVDMGQGSSSIMAQIISEVIGWPYSKITVHFGDTDTDPSAGMTTSSKQTFLTGNAVYYLAQKFKSKLMERAGKEYGLSEEDITISDGYFVKGIDKTIIAPVEDIVRALERNHEKLSESYTYLPPKTYFVLNPSVSEDEEERRLHYAYCFAAQAFIIEANESTGDVRVLKVIAASDVGRAINPAAIEGQIEGGVVMGIGYALSEEYKLDNGFIVTDSLAKLRVPRIRETPEIQSIIIENPHSEGPFGAKGMSELPISLAAPAIATAIHDALGVWITSLPITPDKIREALSMNGE